ncbi:hypothetical protein BpHYR1_020798 [Brachionus plicatilis]|uniref:Uncharacterized protein n=1 Tax=Brachionus plicatilis TaxID=10195 RepID=A0A3M7S947_BRAPC|nr:hypothetical protein BpHYR1_020798 [Brachionus plicatilis]
MSSEAKSRESVLLDPIDDTLNEVEDIPHTQILKKIGNFLIFFIYDLIELVFLLDLWIDIIYAHSKASDSVDQVEKFNSCFASSSSSSLSLLY